MRYMYIYIHIRTYMYTYIYIYIYTYIYAVEGVNATPYEDNMRYFNVAIAGPVGTSYEGKKNCTHICVYRIYVCIEYTYM
jgi:hypothetical protein